MEGMWHEGEMGNNEVTKTKCAWGTRRAKKGLWGGINNTKHF